jgi:hypothetical protein
MAENGNPTQWACKGSPCEELVRDDISKGIGYVCEDDGEIVAVFMFNIGNDPTYEKIYEGSWKSEAPYAVIHRIAVKQHGRGIVDFCFSECFKMYPNIRIDTHQNSIPMQKVLIRNGFEYCGIIYLPNGEERIAFHKV